MEHRPDALAVTTEGREWSYGDLAGMMRRAAGRLAAEGITTGSVVGISGERSVEMIACMLAVWRVRATFVPLDPRYPVERLAHMITQSKPSHLIVDASVGEVLSMALRLTKVVTIDQLMEGCEGDERAHLSGRELHTFCSLPALPGCRRAFQSVISRSQTVSPAWRGSLDFPQTIVWRG